MAQPDAYTRGTIFTGTEAGKDTSQLGINLDSEFNRARATIEAIRANLARIQRDDTALANASVGTDQLTDTVLSLVGSAGFVVRGVWTSGTTYAAGNIVKNGVSLYLVLTAHTAGVFATDQAANKISQTIFDGASAVYTTLAGTAGASLIGVSGSGTVQDSLNGKLASSFQTSLAASSGSSLVGHIASGTGATARTAQAKMREYVSAADFGAVGDGVTNDTTALTNFWNSAIARPGVPHLLDAKTYIFNAALPQINVSNVKIMGAGSYIHNVGSLFTGTMLKWTGGISSGPAIEILSPSGAGNQLKANIEFSGIGLDCNSQLGIGIAVRSIWHSNIDVAVANATLQGVLLTVVAAMGENQSLQRNSIKISSRQIEAPAGVGVYLDGNSVANVSMNEIWLDAVHANNSAVICKNSDNNDWRFVRCYATGSASECVSLLSSNNYGEQARAERFWFLTANKPIQAYGTSTGTYPSTGNQIFCLDKENGTPAPVVATGGVVNWREDDSAMDDTAWLAYTPTITAATGTLTTVASVLGFYRKFGKRVDFKYQWNITTNGTGSVALLATLPVYATGSSGSICAGKERAVTGKMLSGFIDGGGAGTVSIQYADGTYPGVNGGTYTISGTYECAS